MSIEKTTSRVRGLTRSLISASLPPMEIGLLFLMILLAFAGSL